VQRVRAINARGGGLSIHDPMKHHQTGALGPPQSESIFQYN